MATVKQEQEAKRIAGWLTGFHPGREAYIEKGAQEILKMLEDNRAESNTRFANTVRQMRDQQTKFHTSGDGRHKLKAAELSKEVDRMLTRRSHPQGEFFVTKPESRFDK